MKRIKYKNQSGFLSLTIMLFITTGIATVVLTFLLLFNSRQIALHEILYYQDEKVLMEIMKTLSFDNGDRNLMEISSDEIKKHFRSADFSCDLVIISYKDGKSFFPINLTDNTKLINGLEKRTVELIKKETEKPIVYFTNGVCYVYKDVFQKIDCYLVFRIPLSAKEIILIIAAGCGLIIFCAGFFLFCRKVIMIRRAFFRLQYLIESGIVNSNEISELVRVLPFPWKAALLYIAFQSRELQTVSKIDEVAEKGNDEKLYSFSPLEDFTLHPEKIFDPEKKTVFVVDDDPGILFLLQSSLEDIYNVYYAFNGKEALERVGNIPLPDIILCDLVMPEMNGDELLFHIKKMESWDLIPWIFISGKRSMSDKIDLLSQGAVDYIFKPFTIEEILAKVGAVIQFKEREKEHRAEEIKDKFFKFIEYLDNEEKKKTEVTTFSAICRKAGISKREKDVLELLTQGLQNKEIASELSISIRTVEKHVHSIYEKLEVGNRVELINALQERMKGD